MNLTKLFLFSSNLTKTKDLVIKLSKLCSLKMDTVLDEFKTKWFQSLVKGSLQKNAAQVYQFHRAKIDLASFHDMVDFLKEEFTQSKQNVYELHLYLVEKCLDDVPDSTRLAGAALVSHAFTGWKNQMTNASKRKTSDHLLPSCKETICNCKLNETLVQNAFNLVLKRSMSLLTPFNKIYNFTTNYTTLLEPIALNHLTKLNYIDQANLIGELNLQDKLDLERIVVPLMILDRYTCIDDLIKKDQRALLAVIEICDRLCENELNLREVAARYPELKNKKLDRFRPKAIAKYASSCLKKNKKLSLIAAKYPNISFQLKLSQMRFLCNLKYDKASSDPISFEAWCEILLDLISGDEALQYKLVIELIQYQKDVEVAHKIMHIFGYQKMFARLSNSHQEFMEKNIRFISSNQKETVQNHENYYFPSELVERILFVQTREEFQRMLDYFESEKPGVVGMDCEWKPSFDLMDKEDEQLKNRSSTFQIASHKKAFILDMKDLISLLDDTQLDEFGRLVLFNEDLVKLGYSFQQDAQKLAISFPKFRHRFSEFEDSVINIDEIVNMIQKRCSLFEESTNKSSTTTNATKQPKGLSELTRKCFGKPLNKSECISNWDARPLREAQLRYAALDAYVLVQIHDFLQDRLKFLGVDIDYTSKKLFF